MITTFLLAAGLLGAAPHPTDAEPLTLALIVASNRGASLDRPPLQYADDDGAKYQAVFANLAGEENTILLTEFDRDTARLFPALAGRVPPPTRPSLEVAVERLAAASQQARAAGRAVRFYFIFAGHGDVDAGRGFLELADGPFTSDDLEALLHRVAATESHVILDSCNSFFVVNPRKPGGRRFATPRDAAESLSKRLPNVGVFLSTSAEAEVYEWSELESGVFSHAVRSGLLGAADANHDGRITYEELAAFVATSTSEIKNPNYRPTVFARGPNGDDGRVLVDLSRVDPVSIRDVREAGQPAEPSSMRLALRDAEGQRWVDANVEPGQVLTLRLPSSLRGQLEVERLRTSGPQAGSVAARYALPRSGEVVLPALPRLLPGGDSRGVAEIFKGLFARPFGPQALAAWREERASAPEPVYGLSRADAERMGLLLEQLAASEREHRRTSAVLSGTYGLAAATYFGLSAGDRSLPEGDRVRYLLSGSILAGTSVGITAYRLSVETSRERAFQGFREAMSLPGADQVAIAAAFDRQLHEVAKEERSDRRRDAILGWSAFAASTVALVANEMDARRERRSDRVVSRGADVAISSLLLGVALQAQFSTSQTQKLIELWERDPSRTPIELGVLPVGGGAALAVAGRF